MPFNFENLVGPNLVNNKGESIDTSTALNGKRYVMLYFSAHWCPPCRRFTPLLAEAYSAHTQYLSENKNAADASEIQVIFISSDKGNSEFDEYFSTMPWLAVPMDKLWKLNIKESLSKEYNVSGIPMLVILDGETAKVVTKDGRSQFSDYFKGDYSAGGSGSGGSGSGCAIC